MDEKYQRIRVLGKGSFGKAYLVKNTEANELCVVKQMETSMMDKKEREEAVKEAMLLKRMDHRNIVRFQEVFMTRKGRLCIVMDYADGGDVHMEIKRREGKLLPEARILEWFVQTCFALKHVHERKVMHRDLKTQNIFLMATGQIKLGDFGIARVLDATKDYAKTMVGTPYYLSPEIIEDKPYNFKSDIWSLGVVLYEMTTLKHPFDADSLVILASKILKDQYPPPDPMYSSDLVNLIRSMLNKDAKVRPSIKEVLSQPFLLEAEKVSNEKYNLEMDLSEFIKAAAERISLERERQAAAAAGAEAGVRTLPQPGRHPEADDAVLIGTLAAPPTPAAAAEPHHHARHGGGGDDEYDEDFEDYSEPEEGGEHPKSELQQSVANLKLAGAGAAKGSGAGPVPPPPRDAGATLPGISEAGGASASAQGASASGSPGIKAKADSLRAYLKSQMPEAAFTRAYALVRASGEVSTEAEELQRRVGGVIGAEKAPELVPLIQLLCFLEDVSASPQ